VALTFKSPNELVRNLASHAQVHGCFAQTALQWSLGRTLTAEDQELLVAAAEASKRTRGGVSAIMQAIVSAPEFINAVASR
jgi:hypothetical protein